MPLLLLLLIVMVIMSIIIGKISYINLSDPLFYFIAFWRNSLQWARASPFIRFLDHTQRQTTAVRTPLDVRSARRREKYLTTYNTHKGQTSTTLAGFEPTVSAGEWPQTYALDLAATGTVSEIVSHRKLCTGMSYQIVCFFHLWRKNPTWAYGASLFRFLDHTHTHTHTYTHTNPAGLL
jgi:hypothetical protein